jgi:hypothetical protein
LAFFASFVRDIPNFGCGSAARRLRGELRTAPLAKKKSHDAEIGQGLAALREAGVAIDTIAPEIIPSLKAYLGKGRETDLAAIFILGKIGDSAAVDTLAAIERETADKDIKKESKRSLFKLAQRGFELRQEDAAEKRPAALFETAPEIEAYMSAVDGGGGRLIWIAKPQPNRGLQVIQAMLNDREGLLRIGGMHMRRKELRRMAQDIKQKHDVAMIAVPWEFADQTIYEGYEKARAAGRSGLENFHELRSLIGSGKPGEQPHPVYRKLDAAETRDGAWREMSRRLLDEPELRYWILTDEWMQAYLTQIQDAQSSRLVLNPLQKEERLNAIVRDAVKTLCTGEIGRLFKRRMEDMALYFFETGRSDRARLSLAVALQIGEGDPGPLDVSFLTGLMQKSFAFFMSRQKAEKEEKQSGLIIKP